MLPRNAWREESRARQSRRLAPAFNPKARVFFSTPGIVYQQLGDTNRALDSLEKAVSLGISPELIRDTPNFHALGDNQRYVSLLGNQQKK